MRRFAALVSLVTALTGLALLGPAGPAAAASTLTVCQTGPPTCDYTSIKTAVDAAVTGDTVSVAAGTYHESATIDIKKPISIIGAGAGSTVVDGSGVKRTVFTISTPDSLGGTPVPDGPVTLSGMTVQNTANSAYQVLINATSTGSSTWLTGVSFDGMDFEAGGTTLYGVYAQSSLNFVGQSTGDCALVSPQRTLPLLSITNSKFRGTTQNNVVVDGWTGPVTLSGNDLVQGTGGTSAILVFNEYAGQQLTDPVRIENNTSAGRLIAVKNTSNTSFNKCLDSRAGFKDIEIAANNVTSLPSGAAGINVSTYSVQDTPDTQFGTVKVHGNQIHGDGSFTTTAGVIIGGHIVDAQITDNDIVGVDKGVYVIPVQRGAGPLQKPDSVTVNRNRLFADTNGVNNSTSAAIDANANWWGCQEGPQATSAAALEYCSRVANTGSGSVDTSTWVVTTATADTSTLQAGSSSVANVKGTLTKLNTGDLTPTPAPFVDLPASFTATRGTTDPTSTILDASFSASSAYKAPAAVGDGTDTVNVALDKFGTRTGEPVPVQFTITSAAVNPPSPVNPTVTRLAGADRYGTAVAASKKAFPSGAKVVYVASGQAFPDGLSGGPRAAREDSPLLLTGRYKTPVDVLTEIGRLNPTHIYVLGGPAAVSDSVLHQLQALKPTTRIAGPNRYGTAAAVADAWATSPTVYLASGVTFPDALSGGALAAVKDAPLLLTGTGALPKATRAALVRLHPSQVVILGGPVAVWTSVENAVRSTVPVAAVTRIAGTDRYGTSALALQAGGRLATHQLMLASGENFPDALTGGPAAAELGTGFALTRHDCTPQAIYDLVHTGVTTYYLLGGPAAISDAALATRCTT